MTTRIQNFILRNTTGMQNFVNNTMGKRSGLIGRAFKAIEMGKREYSAHTLHRAFRIGNYFWVKILQNYGMMRPIGSRFFGNGNGPINYGGLYVYAFCTACIFARCRFKRSRDNIAFNSQDGVEFWYDRYNMMFPPSFLNQRRSAHYIEIN